MLAPARRSASAAWRVALRLTTRRRKLSDEVSEAQHWQQQRCGEVAERKRSGAGVLGYGRWISAVLIPGRSIVVWLGSFRGEVKVERTETYWKLLVTRASIPVSQEHISSYKVSQKKPQDRSISSILAIPLQVHSFSFCYWMRLEGTQRPPKSVEGTKNTSRLPIRISEIRM